MSWGTSLLALLVGILGVMNTMLMTVFERTHEICVLLAVGWTRRRIIRMVLYESALLGLFGGMIGVHWALLASDCWVKRQPFADFCSPTLVSRSSACRL